MTQPDAFGERSCHLSPASTPQYRFPKADLGTSGQHLGWSDGGNAGQSCHLVFVAELLVLTVVSTGRRNTLIF